MARVISESPRPRYDWDSWLDGQTWELEQGTDFHTPVNTFRHLVKYHVKKRGLRAWIHAPRGTKVWVRAQGPVHPQP